MALKDIFKVSGKTFFNPAGWVGYSEVKSHTNVIWTILRGIVIPPEATYTETFKEAMQRLNLTAKDIAERRETYFNYVLLFLTLGVVIVIYSFYILLIHKTLSGFALGIVSAALFFTQAFKYHFWYTQIKLERLGLTYKEWLANLRSSLGFNS